MKNRYGVTLEQYDQIFENQNGVCAICGEPETAVFKRGCGTVRLSVDHDHETGKVRSLLCNRCNLLLGRVEGNQELIVKMQEYLIG